MQWHLTVICASLLFTLITRISLYDLKPLLCCQERAHVEYPRYTEKTQKQRAPKKYLMGSEEVYEKIHNIKCSDVEIDPPAVASLGTFLICQLFCVSALCVYQCCAGSIVLDTTLSVVFGASGVGRYTVRRNPNCQLGDDDVEHGPRASNFDNGSERFAEDSEGEPDQGKGAVDPESNEVQQSAQCHCHACITCVYGNECQAVYDLLSAELCISCCMYHVH